MNVSLGGFICALDNSAEKAPELNCMSSFFAVKRSEILLAEKISKGVVQFGRQKEEKVTLFTTHPITLWTEKEALLGSP